MISKELDEKIVSLAYDIAPKLNLSVGYVLDRLYSIYATIDKTRHVQTELEPIPPDGLEPPHNRAERRKKAPSNPKYTHKRKG